MASQDRAKACPRVSVPTCAYPGACPDAASDRLTPLGSGAMKRKQMLG